MAAARKRPSPKTDQAKQFLIDYLAAGPKARNEIREAAKAARIGKDLLEKVSRETVTKWQKMGADGLRQSYWELLPVRPPPAPKSQTAVGKGAFGFKEGYSQAVTEMQRKLIDIWYAERTGLSAKKLYQLFDAALRELKQN